MSVDENNFKLFKGFSQRGPSNSTPRNAPSVKLRHQTISFVAAGTNTPVEQEQQVFEEAIVAPTDNDEDQDDANVEEDLVDANIQTNILMDTDIDLSEGAMAQMSLRSFGEASGPDTDNTSSDIDVVGVNPNIQSMKAAPKAPAFFIDTVGDPNLAASSKASGKRPTRRSPSPARSDSSEEVVVFHGRNKPAPKVELKTLKATASPSPAPQRPYVESKPQSAPKPEKPHVSDDLLAALQAGSSSSKPATSSRPNAIGWASRTSTFDQEVNPDATWAPAPAIPYWKKPKPRQDLDPSPAEKLALDDAPPRESKVMFAEPAPKETKVIFAEAENEERDAEETVTSLQADWKATLRLKKQAKSHSPELDQISLKSPTSKRRGKRGRKKDNRQLRGPIDSEEDAAEEAAYDDYMSNLAAQVDGNDSSGDGSQRFTAINPFQPAAFSGPSLVVDGQEIADDEVIEGRLSQMGGDDTSFASSFSGPIGQDTSELSSNDDDGDYSDVDSSDLEDAIEYTEREQWEDEDDLRQRRRERMTDEQLAKLLAKQEEFGITSDDLVIDDGDYVGDVEGVGDVDAARAGLSDITNRGPGRSSNKHGMRRRGIGGIRDNSFPDASAFADILDQYGDNGFDIMDLERPSLRPTKRGRKGKLPEQLVALSDDDLKASMASAWENDRQKKRLKKAEREELRSQGLLGAAGKKGKADFSQKYQFGMSVMQVHEELRLFMQDDEQRSRPFPPMDAKERKALHEIAANLNLKSRSRGSGMNRFTVIEKTSRSFYDPAMFDEPKTWVDSTTKLAKKFARHNIRKAGKVPKGAAAARGGRGGAFDKAAASVRDGEIVGAGAAEISKDSYGHKLMEKMGWSKGMALGKEGEGRLVPVEQMMRTGKAGLG